MTRWRVGIDIGGTFTDAALVDAETGRVRVVKVLTTPQVRERFFSTGAEVVASTPQVFVDEIKSESARLDKVFKAAGIRAE